jgi:hypothetical protein
VYVSILFVRMLLSTMRERNLPDAALLAGTSIDGRSSAFRRVSDPLLSKAYQQGQ